MGETTSQIESYIENKREDLGSNLAELESKVKSITDWREQFRSNPMTMVGVAFGGGVLLASMLGGKSRHRSSSRQISDTPAPHAGTDRQTNMALETWDNIKGALIGVAATRFKDFVGEVIPGFHEQFRKTEGMKSPSGRSINPAESLSKPA
jgi:hypothetical protein